jgi:hypothetical protein
MLGAKKSNFRSHRSDQSNDERRLRTKNTPQCKYVTDVTVEMKKYKNEKKKFRK